MSQIADYSRILKEFYETGGLHDAINREVPLLARFQQLTLDWTGKQAVFAVKVGRGTANTGFKNEGDILPTASTQEKVNLNVGAKLLYGSFELSGPLLASAKNKAGSFVQALEDEMDGAVDDVKNDAARVLYTGNGCVGFIQARAAIPAATPVEFFGNVEEITAGAVLGCNLIRLDTYDEMTYGASPAYGVAAINVTRTAGSMLVSFDQAIDFSDAGLAAGFAGGTSGPAMNAGIPVALVLNNANALKPNLVKEPVGVYGNMAAQNHFGIARNDAGVNTPVVTLPGKQHLRSCIRTNPITGVYSANPLAQSRMEAVLTELQEEPFAGKKTDLLVMRPTTRQSYVALISNSTSLRTDTSSAGAGDVGVGEISYNGIKMMTDRQCGRGLILFMNTKTWKLAQLKAPDVEDIDGNVLSRTDGYDKYGGHVSWYYNTICVTPNCNGALVGFDFPGLP